MLSEYMLSASTQTCTEKGCDDHTIYHWREFVAPGIIILYQRSAELNMSPRSDIEAIDRTTVLSIL